MNLASRALLLCLLLLTAGHQLGCESRPAQRRAPQPTSAASTSAPHKKPLEAGGVSYLELYTGGAIPSQELVMLVAIHGLGDRPQQFQNLFRGLKLPARVILARGLDRYSRGFSWFPIRVREMDKVRLAKGVRHAAGKLAKMIEVLTKRYPTVGRPLVTGFSQGGMLSFALGVEHPQHISAALPLAGWLPDTMWPSKAPANAVPIVALHGDADTVLPIAPTRASVATLRKLGMKVELHEYPAVGHNVSPAMRRALYRQIALVAAQLGKPNTPDTGDEP